jgi:hypothetical protein
MGIRALNTASMVLGLLFMVVSVRLLLHHQYEFFSRARGGGVWISSFFPFLFGLWFFVFGLIGFVRGKRGKRGINHS